MFQLLHAAGTSEAVGEGGGDGGCGCGYRNNNSSGGTAIAAAVGQMVVAVLVLKLWLGLLAEAVGCCTTRISVFLSCFFPDSPTYPLVRTD